MKDYLIVYNSADRYRLKQDVYMAFCEKIREDVSRDFLYSLNPFKTNILTVRSPRPPRDGIFDIHDIVDLPNFSIHDNVIFYISTSPTRSKRGKHIHIKDPLEQREWFSERVIRHGGYLDETYQMKSFESVIRDKGNVPIPITTFMGKISVTNPESFSSMYRNGFGRLGAFGLGMLVSL
ncbi:MAG: type I-E CRISPR-associated protein Cas6/Cse3/CasE [Candidimonas sp.]